MVERVVWDDEAAGSSPVTPISMEPEQPKVEQLPTIEWEYDNFSSEHWKEIEAGKIDKTLSLVKVTTDPENWQKVLTVIANQKPQLKIIADRDQWGTWITFSIGESHFTIAQEDQTKSFLSALISGLTKLKEITDFETTEPVAVSRETNYLI